ncbi:MAG: hypothetical protein JJT90_03515 [Ectothiorhodospiraceae bacterium]|nr:hypothetical protein [Ectothiorhodospiraceae bacterium]
MNAGWLLVAALLAPWAALVLLPWLRKKPFPGLMLPLATVPALLLALVPGQGVVLEIAAFSPGLIIGMDTAARGFLLPTALVWLLAGWYAAGPGAVSERQTAFCALWLAALGGNLLLILSLDLLSFYAGLALMSFAAWGLVVHERSPRALAAGWLYLVMVMLAELGLITAVAWAAVLAGPDTALGFHGIAGSAHPLMLVLLGLGFGIKLGAFGLHTWLPKAHPVAPVPASAVLSGAMIKAGLLGVWRLQEPGAGAFAPAAEALAVLGFAGAFYGAVMGVASGSPKAMLAWSSVSQMGLAVVVVGLAAGAGGSVVSFWPALVILIVHHGLAKAALFLGTGLMARFSGPWRRRVWLALWLPALALASAPFTGGFLVKTAVIQAAEGAWNPGWLAPALSLSSAATAMLMWRFLWCVRAAPAGNGPVSGERVHWYGPYLSLVLLAMLLPWWQAGAAGNGAGGLTPGPILNALWPLVLGGLLAVVLASLRRHFPGSGERAAAVALPAQPFHPVRGVQRWRMLRRLVVQERRLHGWPAVGRVVMCLLLALAALLWL